MFRKYMTAGLLGSALLTSTAFAQSPSAATTAPAAAPVTASDANYNGNWRASKVVGLSVYNEANESLGSINDLLTDKAGNIKARNTWLHETNWGSRSLRRISLRGLA